MGNGTGLRHGISTGRNSNSYLAARSLYMHITNAFWSNECSLKYKFCSLYSLSFAWAATRSSWFVKNYTWWPNWTGWWLNCRLLGHLQFCYGSRLSTPPEAPRAVAGRLKEMSQCPTVSSLLNFVCFGLKYFCKCLNDLLNFTFFISSMYNTLPTHISHLIFS